MMTPMILSTLVGSALGLRFKALVLLPALLLAIALAVGTTLAQDGNAWSILIAIALNVTGLQIGFLCGAAARVLHSRSISDRPRGAVSSSAR